MVGVREYKWTMKGGVQYAVMCVSAEVGVMLCRTGCGVGPVSRPKYSEKCIESWSMRESIE